MCRHPITDQMTRITGPSETILVDKEFRVSVDGRRWSEEYNDLDAIVWDHFGGEIKLCFERYSVIRDYSYYFARSETLKDREDLIRTFTFFPQDQTNDDHVHQLIDGIDPDVCIRFTQKNVVAKAKLWLSLVWMHNREIVRPAL